MGAHPETGICELVEERIGDDGADFVSSHRSRVLTVDDIAGAGLILTASRAERAAVARLEPSARSRTFTLREAAALAAVTPRPVADAEQAADPDPLVGFAATLHARRGLVAAPRASGRAGFWRRSKPVSDPLDIVDGHNLGVRQHRSALDEVASSVEGVLRGLRSPVG